MTQPPEIDIVLRFRGNGTSQDQTLTTITAAPDETAASFAGKLSAELRRRAAEFSTGAGLLARLHL